MTLRNAKIAGVQVPMAQYRGHGKQRGDPDFPLGSSDLRKILDCPHKWRFSDEDDGARTEATKWGTLIDSRVLGGDQSLVAVAPAFYRDAKTNEEKPWNWNAKVCDAWKEEHIGKLIVSHATGEKAQLAAGRLRDDRYVAAILAASCFQVMLTADYHDGATGISVPVRGLVDVLPAAWADNANTLADLKTTSNAQPKAWGRAVNDRGYHVQGALYLDLWNALGVNQRTTFRHIVQESEAPYEVCTRMLSDEFVVLGRALYETALHNYCVCLKTGCWPGYDTGSFDGWAITAPEPWMVAHAGVSIPDSPMPTFGEDERAKRSGV